MLRSCSPPPLHVYDPTGREKGTCVPTVQCKASLRPLGIFVRVFLHLQVHELEGESRGIGDAHGVRIVLLVLYALTDMLELLYSFENALLDKEPNTILTGILTRFILNLRPTPGSDRSNSVEYCSRTSL